MNACRSLSAIAIAASVLLLPFTNQQCADSGTVNKTVDLQTHPDTAVVLEQTSTLGKRIKCTVTKKLFKLELAHPHCILIADAANPNVLLMYSPEHKLYFREPPSKLNVLDFSLDAKQLYKNSQKPSSCTVAGIPATKYTSFPNMEIDNQLVLPTLSSSIDNAPTQRAGAPKVIKVIRSDYFATTALNVPPQAIEAMSAIVHTPKIHGLPLGLVITKSDGKQESIFYTSSISYTHVDKSFFECPISYKPARTDMECMFGSEKVGQLEDIFKDMAVGKDFGTRTGSVTGHRQ
jgi:hypothetical protein